MIGDSSPFPGEGYSEGINDSTAKTSLPCRNPDW